MAKLNISEYRIISTSQLVRAISEGKNNSERFCFIIGSGASESSGIPTGSELEKNWMEDMEKDPGLIEVRVIAEKLKRDNLLENDFKVIEKAWEETKKSGVPLPSKFYFDIYTLRFFPNHRNGYHYYERIMANKCPSFGYHPLALMLTDGNGNNLVITTNFDNLVEDALFLYTNSKPLVINHELLAEFAGDPNIKRPIIAKVHRGIFFDPLNKPDETNALKGKWHDVLTSVFQSYTPIVIGYGGGDNSLMDLLADKNVKMKNGIYWCYVEEYGLPGERIQKLVQEKKGYLVSTAGFDATMLAIGNAIFPEKIGVHETEEYLYNRTSMHIENYEKEYKKLAELQMSSSAAMIKKQKNQSEDDFQREIEKITERANASENVRQKTNQMTAWDYWRQGSRYFDDEEYDKAIDSYNNAINKQQNIAVFYESLGCAYGSLGDTDNAILYFNRAIELNPNDDTQYYNRGWAYSILGDYDKALRDYTRAIELNPTDDGTYSSRGSVFYELGKYQHAISDYSEAIRLNPSSADSYSDRGYIYYTLGDYDKAISDCNKAIELDPNHANAYTNRGGTYICLHEYDKAISDCGKAIKLNPDEAESHKHCGVAWREKGDVEKAIQFLTRAIELNPQYIEAYRERAKAYRLIGDNDKAIDDESTAEKLSQLKTNR